MKLPFILNIDKLQRMLMCMSCASNRLRRIRWFSSGSANRSAAAGMVTAKSLLKTLNERDSAVELTSRALLRLSGSDTSKFLQGLLTNDVNKLASEKGLYTALLTPQGRVVGDLFLHATDHGIVVDCDASLVDSLQQHFKRYILRSKVRVEQLPGSPWQAWGQGLEKVNGFPDPRHASLGWRCLQPIGGIAKLGEEVYKLKRMLVGVPEGSLDFFPSQALPLECNMDYMNGVDFHKGCYVGQELTIRTHHKGVVRKRIVPVQLSQTDTFPDELSVDTSVSFELPASASEISRLDGGKKDMGKFCSGMHNLALALVRLDLQGHGKTANGLFVKPFVPDQFE